MHTTDKSTVNLPAAAGGGDCSCITRRQFLFYGTGAAVSLVALATLPGAVASAAPRAVLSRYPRKRIATLADLEPGVPIHFKYPGNEPLLSASFLVKLAAPAGGGVGPDGDIVAFNAMCPHMGGSLMGTYKHEFKAAGPCPFHLSTFDLTKHGMIIAGHATESLPQVVLEVAQGDIYAAGMLGLIYGTHDSAAG